MSLLVKATLTHLATLESFQVLWNPQSYRVSRTNQLASPALVGVAASSPELTAGGIERFSTRCFLDSTEGAGPDRDLGPVVERLERWSRPDAGEQLPPRLLFAWGPFRFRGVVEDLQEEWIRFDADGTPIRAWVDLTLRR